MTEQHQIFNRAGQPIFTTDEAAGRMGISRGTLLKLVERHEAIHPAIRSAGAYFWTESEIEAAVQKKATAKRGRPAK